MAIKIKFDSEHNLIPPTLVLATRGGRKLGAIPATSVRFKDNMNAASELSFEVFKDPADNSSVIWDEITDLKLVWCKEWDTWFEIEVEVNETDSVKKSVSGTSLAEAELSQINLYNIEVNTEEDMQDYLSLHPDDDYVPTIFFDPANTERSLLHRLLQKAPHYRIGFVDPTLVSEQRTFSFDDKSIYDAFQEVSEELKCLFVLDSGSTDFGVPVRRVNVYNAEYYGEDTGIFVTTDNLTDEVRLTTDVGAIKNCFKLQAGDDLMTAVVKGCNPNGSDYIWYFTDRMLDDMPQELRDKVTAYTALQKTAEAADYTSTLSTGERAEIGITGSISGFSALIDAQYAAIDKLEYYEHNMMPSVSTEKPTMQEEAEKVQNGITYVAVSKLGSASEATVTSSLKSRARAIVDNRYNVDVSSVTYNQTAHTVAATVSVTSYDDNDTSHYDATFTNLPVTDGLEEYVRQNIDIVLHRREGATDAYNIPAVAQMPYSTAAEKAAFKSKIAEYCLSRLESLYDGLRACMDILMEQNIASGTWEPDLKAGLYDPYREKLTVVEQEIADRQASVNTIQRILGKIEARIAAVHDELNLENYFGEAMYKELSAYRRDDTYQNENYISDGLDNAQLIENAHEFFDRAVEITQEAAYGTHSISAKLANLLTIKEFEPLVKSFEVGNWIRVRADGRIFELRLLQYEIDYDSIDDLSVEFSDYNAVRDGVSQIEQILKSASSMSSSFSYVAHQASKGVVGNNTINSIVQNGLDLTKTKIVDNANNQCITFDENGLLGRRQDPATGEYDPQQIKILNNGMYVTDDNWDTVSAAFGEIFYQHPTQGTKTGYGVIAKALVGDEMILGDMFAYHGALFYIKLENAESENRSYHVVCLNGYAVPPEHRNVFPDPTNPEHDSIFGALKKIQESSSGIGFVNVMDTISEVFRRIIELMMKGLVYPAFLTDFYSIKTGADDPQYVAVRNGRVYTSNGLIKMSYDRFLAMVEEDEDQDESPDYTETVIATDDDIAGQTINGFGFSPLPTEIIEGVDPAAGQLSGCHIIATTGDENTISGTITFDNFVCGGSDMVGASVSLIYLTSSDYQVTSGTFAIEFDGGVIEYGSAIDIGGSVTLNWELSSAMAGYSGSAILSLDLNYTQQ